jgi:putative endonuclease
MHSPLFRIGKQRCPTGQIPIKASVGSKLPNRACCIMASLSIRGVLQFAWAVWRSSTEYLIWMGEKDRRPKATPPDDTWFVYLLRCADGSLYTGITKDVKRRRQQHNNGTASRYTRGRRPTKQVWQESHPSRSSALKREAAIKAMTRREKMALIRLRKKAR